MNEHYRQDEQPQPHDYCHGAAVIPQQLLLYVLGSVVQFAALPFVSRMCR
jgi:hypothetical protein